MDRADSPTNIAKRKKQAEEKRNKRDCMTLTVVQDALNKTEVDWFDMKVRLQKREYE